MTELLGPAASWNWWTATGLPWLASFVLVPTLVGTVASVVATNLVLAAQRRKLRPLLTSELAVPVGNALLAARRVARALAGHSTQLPPYRAGALTTLGAFPTVAPSAGRATAARDQLAALARNLDELRATYVALPELLKDPIVPGLLTDASIDALIAGDQLEDLAASAPGAEQVESERAVAEALTTLRNRLLTIVERLPRDALPS